MQTCLCKNLLLIYYQFCVFFVVDLPIIRSNTVDGVVKIKSRVVLTCEVSDPNSLVSWTLNEQAISADNSIGVTFSNETKESIVIPVFRGSSKSSSQSGDWRCISDGLVSKKLRLTKARK